MERAACGNNFLRNTRLYKTNKMVAQAPQSPWRVQVSIVRLTGAGLEVRLSVSQVCFRWQFGKYNLSSWEVSIVGDRCGGYMEWLVNHRLHTCHIAGRASHHSAVSQCNSEQILYRTGDSPSIFCNIQSHLLVVWEMKVRPKLRHSTWIYFQWKNISGRAHHIAETCLEICDPTES